MREVNAEDVPEQNKADLRMPDNPCIQQDGLGVPALCPEQVPAETERAVALARQRQRFASR